MKRYIKGFLALLFTSFIFSSCEDIIDVNLNDAAPRVVIEADLDNLDRTQVIYVSRTVPFNDNRRNEIIKDAFVAVMNINEGHYNTFIYSGEYDGYIDPTFKLERNTDYALVVEVDGKQYQAWESMPHNVEVDSLGRVKETIFGDDYYFATFKFQDPADVNNYYKYNVSVDGAPMKFYSVFNDKFNDGLYVTHQIGSVDNDITLGSMVVVKRQMISYAVYKYWNEVQSVNPGSAAPANPTSNISNGALGYFSVSNAKEYSFDFSTFDEEDE